MEDDVDKFSRDLEPKLLEKALKLKEKLDDQEYDNNPTDINVHTDKIFQKGFSFSEVARNDFSKEQFDMLEIAENDLNHNLDNKNLTKKFITTA